jgi:hypothetical protein
MKREPEREDAEACAEFALPEAAAVVITWPPPKRPFP